MTTRVLASAAFLTAVMIGLLAGAEMRAQGGVASAPVAQNVPPPQPPRDELIEAWLETAKVAAQLAQTQCTQLDSVKQFNRIQLETTRKVEARVPGYTINWQTFSLERVKAPATK